MMIAIFFWWIGLSIVVAVAANTRGRSPIAWFIYAIIFSPRGRRSRGGTHRRREDYYSGGRR